MVGQQQSSCRHYASCTPITARNNASKQKDCYVLLKYEVGPKYLLTTSHNIHAVSLNTLQAKRIACTFLFSSLTRSNSLWSCLGCFPECCNVHIVSLSCPALTNDRTLPLICTMQESHAAHAFHFLVSSPSTYVALKKNGLDSPRNASCFNSNVKVSCV
jgi:hypothetical protein